MSWENVLLLFTENQPCWNEELISLAGEDPDLLHELRTRELVEQKGNIYYMTEKGKSIFRKIAQEYFYEASPGSVPTDPAREIMRCKLSMLLNRSFVGRWGVKKFYQGQILSFYPGLTQEKICTVNSSGEPEWLYNDLDMIDKIRNSFPPDRVNDLHPSLKEIDQWMQEQEIRKGSLEIDLLFLHYCDFMYYMHKTSPVSDTLKLLHADRFFMKFTREEFYSDPISLFEEIGRFHLFLFYCRHLILPGNFDMDIHQQENLNALMYITETEKEAVKFFDHFHLIGDKLTGPAKPLDIWVFSMESLENHPFKEDSHFDLFEKVGHRVAITYPE